MDFELTRTDLCALALTLSPSELDGLIRKFELEGLFFQDFDLDDVEIISEESV